jgi:hypothetical protein
MAGLLVRAVAASALVAGLAGLRADAQAPDARPANPTNTDGVLAAYLAGDQTVIDRFFKTSLDFQNRLKLQEPKEFDRWLGEYDQAKAVFVLSLAQASVVTARQYTPVLLLAGERYVDGGPGLVRNTRPGAPVEFARAWHRAAIAVLQGMRNAANIDAHVAAVAARRRDVASEPRLLLARGIANEIRCWFSRPSLEQPSLRVEALAKAAGIVINNDLDGPAKAVREAQERDHFKCLNQALEHFDTARTDALARPEASVRGGWVLVQQARFQDALAWVDAAVPGNDRPLAYWRGLVRGRALGGLDRHREASEAYREAFELYPGAQTAGLGLAFELKSLDRDEDADQIARALRKTAATAVDPWTTYLEGDARFAAVAVEQMRRRFIQ